MAKDSQDYQDGFKDGFEKAKRDFIKISFELTEVANRNGKRDVLVKMEKSIQASITEIDEQLKAIGEVMARKEKPELKVVNTPRKIN